MKKPIQLNERGEAPLSVDRVVAEARLGSPTMSGRRQVRWPDGTIGIVDHAHTDADLVESYIDGLELRVAYAGVFKTENVVASLKIERVQVR